VLADSHARDIEERGLELTTPDSFASILYTSGTTGEPKGVVLTQKNLTSNALATVDAFGERENDLRLNFLPLSHIFARTCDMNTWIARGSQLALAESRETVIADCQTVCPTLLNGVPYFYDKVRRFLCDHGLADREGALRAALGGKVRACCSGGAALPDHVYDFFMERGVPLLQGYGLSESSPVISLSNEITAAGVWGGRFPASRSASPTTAKS
jgi:long-chain acyl-CoA synthetase